MRTARWIGSVASLLAVVAVLAVLGLHQGVAAPPGYIPQTRNFTVTTVPLAVHEMQASMPFLKKAFAAGGVLGPKKEVYGFYPSTLVVYQGDTVNLTIVNPQDDDHTFTIHDLKVDVEVKGLSTARTSFVAKKVGVFTFMCDIEEHMPYMWGQLVVLPDSAAR